MKEKKTHLNVYVTPEFAREIKKNAELNHVSVSMYINLAIQTLATIHESGEIPKLTLNRMFREYPVPSIKQVEKWVDEQAEKDE